MQTDILIVGGGLVGLMAARALSKFYTVTVLEKSTEARPDNRTTAFLRPSLTAMQDWDVWDGEQGQPLETLRLIDAQDREATTQVDFIAPDGQPFGQNIANADLKMQLEAHSQMVRGVTVERILSRDDCVQAILSNGDVCRARLLVVADGKFSPTREMIGIKARTLQTGQTALSFPVRHADHAHNSVSTEIYNAQMSCTLVPMQDPHQSAIVWMMPTRDLAQALDDVNTAVTHATCNTLGALDAQDAPGHWPVVSVLADTFYGHRCVLIGETAHAMPPIGAQGLNTSVRDIITLLESLSPSPSPSDPGDAQGLKRYARARRPDAAARVASVNAYNVLTKTTALPASVRKRAFDVLNRYKSLQQPLIQLGYT